MPELPEVETTATAIRPHLIGRSITNVRNTWRRHIDRPKFSELVRRLLGHNITGVSRRGKFLLIHLDGEDTLLIHLRMSGQLFVAGGATPADKHTHTIFELDNGSELRFRDTRKFGRVYLVADKAEILGKLGPEPLGPEFTLAVLRDLIRGKKRTLKPFLLDQTIIAGIGNIYADEALFYARLHPRRKTDSLDAEEIANLFNGIKQALQLGIDHEGATISTYVKPSGEKGNMQNSFVVFRRTGEPCLICNLPVERIVVGGRSTHFCPRCQT